MPDPNDHLSSWLSRKSIASARLALEVASELFLYEREGRSPQDIMELQLDWITASMRVVRLEAAEAVVVPSMLKLTPSPLQQKLASLQKELNFTLRSLHAYLALSSSSTPESSPSSSETPTGSKPASDS